jgi:NitT/TauT family transport system permease protein
MATTPMAAVDENGQSETGAVVAEAISKLRRKERVRRRMDLVLSVGTPIVLIILWQVSADAHFIDPRIFTPPTQIIRAARQLISKGILQKDIGFTLARLLVGYVIGVISGVIVGLILGLVRPLRSAFSPLFAALYAVPQIALLPLLLVIFGIGETPKILTVVAVTFFVLEINALAAVRNFDPRLIESGKAFGAHKFKLFRHVILPGSLPSIFTGLRVSIALGLVVITATEFVASNNGLGFLVWNSWQLFQPDQMYVGLVTIALVGVILTGIIVLIERLSLPWLVRRKR